MTTPATDLLNDVDLDAVADLTNAVLSNPAAASTVWCADVTWQRGFQSSAQIRAFPAVHSDEPPALGGNDSGPNPVEQLLAALGNCLAVGYAANATARGIELTKLRIAVTGDLDLRSFLGLRPGHAGFQGITATVHLDSDATQGQLEDLHRAVVGSSPVGHTLQAPIPTTIQLASEL
ncbi:MAG: OsmC family protein [Candidatus Nanopelagicales bacterium]